MGSARTIKLVDLVAVIAVAVVVIVVILNHGDFSCIDDFVRFKTAKRACPECPVEVSVALAGDVMLSRDVARKMREHGDPDYPFLAVRDYLTTADIVFGNLESPITPGRDITTHEMVFRADPGVEAALARAGFTVVSLANNHIFDFGEEGLRDTIESLQKAGIQGVGAGFSAPDIYEPAYIERKGVRFSFLAFCDDGLMPRDERLQSGMGLASLDDKKMVAAVREAKKRADIVIVSMHAGVEYDEPPDPAQVVFARAAIDAGADLVVGHHPHVIQRFERYKGGYILYSLGNLVFDQMWSQATREGLIAKAVFNGKELARIELVPVDIEDSARPVPLYGARADAIIERLRVRTDKRHVYSWDPDGRRFIRAERRMVSTAQNRRDTEFKVLKTLEADLSGDGHPERYDLRDGRLRISESSRYIWSTPETWWVDDVALADATGDGVLDINMSVWRAGNFGTTKPFWMRENDLSIKNHFFVFGFRDGIVKAIWQSSNLDAPNREFCFDDIDGDGRQELIVIEGEYSGIRRPAGRYVAVWRWDEWGFFNEWRSPPGSYRNLAVEGVGSGKHIIVDGADSALRQGYP
jgi:poly-gamma-glutamate synthesis protein (capsule biosynthesis protein)